MKNIARELAAAVILLLAAGAVAADSYRVEIGAATPRIARVEAELAATPEGCLLLARDAEDSGIEGGWARFLEQMQVEGPAGENLPVTREEGGRFCLGSAAASLPVTVRYRLRLGHDRVPNLPGADELAWARDDAVLWTGRAIFLEGQPASDVEVTFALPEAWRATTPWRTVEAGRSFRAADTDALLDAAFIAGRHFEATLGEGPDPRVRIALAGDGAISAADRLVETVDRYLTTFSSVLGAPPAGRLLLVAADGSFWGGGVIGTTISMMLGGALDDATLPTLRFVTVHELFHLWNANFRYAGDAGIESLYWMTEGTASYYTMRSQLGHGEIAEGVVLVLVAKEIDKYLAAAGGLSMVAAGADKLHHYDLVYSGGFAASLALDLAVRSGSGGEYSLDDVMRSLASGAGREVALDAGSFATLIESTTGVDVDDLFECCIRGGEQLPLVELLARAGFVLELASSAGGAAVLRRVEAPSTEAEALWAAWPIR